MRAKVVVLLGALSVLLAAPAAQAQVIFMGRPGGWFGGSRIQPISYGFPGYSSGFSPWGYGMPGYGYGAPGYGYGMPWGGYNPYAGPWGYGASPYASYAYGPAYLPGWAVSSSTTSPRTRPSLYPAVAVPPERIRAALYESERRSASMQIQLPNENAEVWFDDVKMTQTGRVRDFVTPALEAGSTYEYAVRVRWNDGGKMRETVRPVSVQAGDRLRLDFSKSPL